MSLWSDFLGNADLRAFKCPHYFPIYERHFSRFVNQDLLLFEIGVLHGGGLQLWKKYFGPHARIVGVDINKKCVAAEEDQISVRIGDQGDPVFLDRLIDEFGSPDIVIDDGSHHSKHMNFTFNHLYPKQNKNSVYLVEDTHACYWEEYGGGREGSFIESTKKMIDLLHAPYTRGKIQPTEFTNTTASIHVYDSVVVFEKQAVRRRFTVTGRRLLEGVVPIKVGSAPSPFELVGRSD